MKAPLLLAALLSIALPISAMAQPQPRVIGDLSDGALLGQIESTAQLQHDFSTQRPLLAQASERLGLSREDFRTVRRDIAQGDARYVLIPRHLDGMAGEHGGVAFAVHNIIIPAGVHGWEVDLPKPGAIVRVFIPNRCGNISYLRVSKPRQLAAVLPHRVALPPLGVLPGTFETPMPMSTPAPAPVAFAPVVAPAPPPPVAHAYHFPWLPILALAIIGVAFGHGGSVGSGPPTVTSVPTPAPIHTICPTTAIRIP